MIGGHLELTDQSLGPGRRVLLKMCTQALTVASFFRKIHCKFD